MAMDGRNRSDEVLKPFVHDSVSQDALDEQERSAEERGALQFNSGVVRVADTPRYEDPVGTSAIHKGGIMGISSKEELMNKVGLTEGQRFTDYIGVNGGRAPDGFEIEAKMLMHQEKVQEYERQYLAGSLGYSDFLFKAYGKDLMKADGHDMSSEIYWYNRRKNGSFDRPTDNMAYMSNVIERAEALYQAEVWYHDSWTRRVDDSLFSDVTGVKVDGMTFRELFPEYVEAMDEYFETTEEMIRLYQAGLLEGFDPTIDTNGDGMVDRYFHTNGILYEVQPEGHGVRNPNVATAHYNSDGSLNRIVLPGLGGEITDSFIKSFANVLTAGISLVGYAGASMLDLGQGLLGQGFNFETLTDFYLWSEGWKNDQAWLNSRIYSTTSGFRDQAGDLDTMAITRGVASGAGMILGLLATAKLGGAISQFGTGLATKKGAAATQVMSSNAARMSKAGLLGTKIAAKTAGPLKVTAAYGFKGLGASMSSLTGLSNGMPVVGVATKSATALTIQGLSFLAVRDFTTSVATLNARKPFHDLTDQQIVTRAMGMTALNFGVSYYMRSILDKAALSRLADHKVAKLAHARGVEATKMAQMIRAGQVNANFVRLVDNWAKKSPRSFMLTNAGMDIFENLLTMATHTSLSQTGNIWDADAVKTLWNPQTIAQQMFIFTSTYKGGLARGAEGLETGGQLINIRNVKNMYDQSYLRLTNTAKDLQGKGKQTDAQAILRLRDAAEARLVSKDNQGNVIKAYSDALDMIHRGTEVEGGRSVLTAELEKTFNRVSRQEILRSADMAMEHYKALETNIYDSRKGFFTGRGDSFINFRRKHIREMVKTALPRQMEAEVHGRLIKELRPNSVSNEIIRQASESSQRNLEKMIEDGKLEIIGLNNRFEKVKDWDGKGPGWKVHSRLNDLSDADVQALKEAGYSSEQVSDGVIIRFKGAGTVAEGSEEYNLMTRALDFMGEIARLESEGETAVPLIHKVDMKGKDAAYFIPYFNLGEQMSMISHIGYGLRFIMDMRYAQTVAEKQKALKSLAAIIGGAENIDQIKDEDMVSLIGMMVTPIDGQTRLLTLREANEILTPRVINNLLLDRMAYATEIVTPINQVLEYRHLMNEVRNLIEVNNEIANRENNRPYARDKRNITKIASALERNHVGNRRNEAVFEKVLSDMGLTKESLKPLLNYLKSPQQLAQERVESLFRLITAREGDRDVDQEMLVRFLSEKLGSADEFSIRAVRHAEAVKRNIDDQRLAKPTKALLHAVLGAAQAPGLGIFNITSDTVREIGAGRGTPEASINTAVNRIIQMKRQLLVTEFSNDAKYGSFLAERFTNLMKANPQIREVFEKSLPNIKEVTLRELSDPMLSVRHPNDSGTEVEVSLREFVTNTVLHNDKNLAEAVPRSYSIESVLGRALEYSRELNRDTEAVPGRNTLFINLAELEGKAHARLTELIRTNPEQVQRAMKADSTSQRLKILYGGNNDAQFDKALAQEQSAMRELRALYPEGVIAMRMDADDPAQREHVAMLLHRLGYDFYDIREDMADGIPGVYYKAGEDLAVPLKLIGNTTKKSIIQKLQQRFQTEVINSAKQQLNTEDYVRGMDEIFGGLVYLREDSVLRPDHFVYTNVRHENMTLEGTRLLTAINALEGLDYKGGKIAGLLRSLYQEVFSGIGYQGIKDPNLDRAKFVLDVIDKADDYLNSDATGKRPLYITLDDTQHKVFTTNERLKNMWKLTPFRTTNSGKEYTLTMLPEFKSNALLYVRDSVAKNGGVDMRYILPYAGYEDANNRILFADARLGDNFAGTNLVAFVRTYLSDGYTNDEFNNFMTRPIALDRAPLSMGERDNVLKAFKGKTAIQIMSNRDANDSPILTNKLYESPEVQMMLSTIKAGLLMSEAMSARDIFQDFDPDFFARMGNASMRKVIGEGIKENLSNEQIADRIIAHQKPEFEQGVQGVYFREKGITREQGVIRNNNVRELNTSTDYVLPSRDVLIDEVKLFRSLFDNLYIPSKVDVEKVAPNIYAKLYSMINTANDVSDDQFHIYTSLLYRLSPDEFKQAIEFLEESGVDVDLLRSKSALLQSMMSDLYPAKQNAREIDVTVSRLVPETMKVVGQEQTTHAVIDRLAGDMKALETALKHSANRAKNTMDSRMQIKMSDLSQADGEYSMMIRKLAEAINAEVRVNNFGSSTLANLDVFDVLGQFIQNIERMSSHLMNTDFKVGGHRLAPEEAVELAWEMMLNSSGADTSREWTKYLIYDLQTKEIASTAKFMAQGGGFNHLFRELMPYLTNDQANMDRYVVFKLDKNMMLDNRTGGDKRASYIPLTDVREDPGTGKVMDVFTKTQLIDNMYRLGLEQYDPRIHGDVPRETSDWHKVVKVYANAIPKTEMATTVVKNIETLGRYGKTESARKLARNLLMSTVDVDVAKPERTQQEEATKTFFSLDHSLTTDQKALENKQQKRINSSLRYFIEWESMPEEVQRSVRLEGEIYNRANEKDIQRFNIENIGDAFIRGNQGDLDRALRRVDINRLGDADKDKMMNLLTNYVVLNARDGKALNMLMTQGNIADAQARALQTHRVELLDNNGLDFRDAQGTRLDHTNILKDGVGAHDTEVFYRRVDGEEQRFLFQYAYSEYDGVGDYRAHIQNRGGATKVNKSMNVFVPVFVNGELVKTREDIARLFPDFKAKYDANNDNAAVSEYLGFVARNPNITEAQVKTPGYVSSQLEAAGFKTDIPILSFRGDAFDLDVMRESGLFDEKSFVLKNNLDVYNKIVKGIHLDLKIPGQTRKLEYLTEHILGPARVRGSHEARQDNNNLFEVTVELLNRVTDINKLSTGQLDDMREFGKIIYGRELSDAEMQSKVQIRSLSRDGFEGEAREFIESYRELWGNRHDEMNKMGQFLKSTIEDFQKMFIDLERDVHRRKHKQYTEQILKQDTGFYTKMAEGHDREMHKFFEYILEKMGVAPDQYQRLFDDENVRDDFMRILKDAYKPDKGLSEDIWKEIMMDDPRNVIDRIKNTGRFTNLSVEEFDERTKEGAFGTRYSKFVNTYIAANEEAYYRDISELDRHSLAYKAGFNHKPLLENLIDGSGSEVFDSYMRSEFATYYNKNVDDNYRANRRYKRSLWVGNNLTAAMEEILKNPPIKTITLPRFYKLVSAFPMSRTATYKGKVQKLGSNDILMGINEFREQFGSTPEALRAEMGLSPDQDLYMTMIRHPFAVVDSIHGYRIVLSDDPNHRIHMGTDALKSFHQGDVDGDHVTLLKPSKATMMFSNITEPYNKAGLTLLDKITESTPENKLKMPTEQDLQVYTEISRLLKDVTMQDREAIKSKQTTYESLKETRIDQMIPVLERLRVMVDGVEFKNLEVGQKREFAEAQLKHTWLIEKEVGNLVQGKDKIYITNNREIQDQENVYNKKLFANMQQMNKDTYIKFDQVTGQLMKKALGISEKAQGRAAEIFNHAGMTITDETMRIIENNFQHVQSAAIRELQGETRISDEIKQNVIRMFTEAKDGNDILAALQTFEKGIFESDAFNDAAIKAYESFAPDIREENLTESERVYKQTLLEMLDRYANDPKKKEEVESLKNNYVGGILEMADLLHAFDTMEDNLRFSDPIAYNRSKDITEQLLNEMNTGSTSYHNTLGGEGYQNYITGDVVFLLKDLPGIGRIAEDSAIKLPGADNVRHASVGRMVLNGEDRFIGRLNEGAQIKAGQKVSALTAPLNRDILVVGREGSTLYYTTERDLSPATKVTVAGSAIAKSTIQERMGEFSFESEGLRGIFENAHLLTRSEAFDPSKLTGITQEGVGEVRYYDSRGRQVTTKNLHKAVIAVVKAPITIVEDDRTFSQVGKTTTIDEAGISNNSRSLNGALALGDEYIKVVDGPNGKEFLYDSRSRAEAERTMQQLQMPDYQGSNAARFYNLAIIKTLLKHTGLSLSQKAQYVEEAMLLKEAGGAAGQALIREIFERFYVQEGKTMEELRGQMNSWERALFNQRIQDAFYQKTASSIKDPQEITTKGQLNKLINLRDDVTKKASRSIGNSLDADNLMAHNGEYIADRTEGYVSMSEFQRLLGEAYNDERNMGEGIWRPLSRNDIQKGTAEGVFNTRKGFPGAMENGFGSISSLDADRVEVFPNIQGAAITDKKAGFSATDISKQNLASKYATSDINRLGIESTQNRHNLNEIEDGWRQSFYKDYFNRGFGKNEDGTYSIKEGIDNEMRTGNARLKKYMAGALAKASTALGKARYHNRSPETISVDLAPKKIEMDGNDLRITYDNKVVHTTPENWLTDVMAELSSSRHFDQRDESFRSISGDAERLRDENPEIARAYEQDKTAIEPPRLDPLRDNLFEPTPNAARDYYRSKGVEAKTVESAMLLADRMVTFGNENNLDHTFKYSPWTSSGLKIEPSGDINVDRMIVGMVKEQKYMEMHYGAEYITLFNDAQRMDAINDVNKYAFIVGTKSRLDSLERMMDQKGLPDKDYQILKQAHDAYQEKMFTELSVKSMEEVEGILNNTKQLYPRVLTRMEALNDYLLKEGRQYAIFSDEANSEMFALLTPNHFKGKTGLGSDAQRAIFRTNMFVNADPKNINADKFFEGPGYFDNIGNVIKKLSEISSKVNNASRMKEAGYMQNGDVINFTHDIVDSFKETFSNYVTRRSGDNPQIIAARSFIDGVREFASNADSRVLDQARQTAERGMIGEAYLMILDELRLNTSNSGKSLSEAVIDLKNARPNSAEHEQAKQLVNMYTMLNDTLVMVSSLGDKGMMEQMYDRLMAEAGRRGQSLVDQYGRIMHEDLDKASMLSQGSTEFAKNALRLYSRYNGGFKANVVMKALEGDIFFMNKTLAEHMDKHYFTHKTPGAFKKSLLKTQRLFTKLIMSNVARLPDRMGLFTGFDFMMSTLLNPKSFTKMGKAKNELSAFAQSKGTVTTPELRQFLKVNGIDPNKPSYNVLFNNSRGFNESGGALQGYFNISGKQLTLQHMFMRYAAWLQIKNDLDNGKMSYGAAFHQRDMIDRIEGRMDAQGREFTTKAEEQAQFLISQQFGAFNDFPFISKQLNGYMMFTTFPLALVRWGIGQSKSLHSAAQAAFLDHDPAGMKYLMTQGLGIAGIYLLTGLLTDWLAENAQVDEEIQEEWKERQAMPEFFKSFLQGEPIMNTFSSHNPVRVAQDLSVGPVMENIRDEDGNLASGLWDWTLNNIASRGLPGVRTAAEVLGGRDLIGGTVIDNSDRYSMWENFVRKMGAMFIGGAGANEAMRQYEKMRYNDEDGFGSLFAKGLGAVVSAELGNTRTYKQNNRNYWKANNLIQSYRFADGPPQYSSSNDFDLEAYSATRRQISRMMHNEAKFSEIYNFIQEQLEEGVSDRELMSAMRNNSLEYKLSRIADINSFWRNLDDDDKKIISDALAYERAMFPWLRSFEDAVAQEGSRSRFTPTMRNNNQYWNTPWRYNNTRPPFIQTRRNNEWRQPITSSSPIETFREVGNYDGFHRR